MNDLGASGQDVVADVGSRRVEMRVRPAGDWGGKFRVESIMAVPPDADGWLAYDLALRPLDRRGRANGRAKRLTTMKVGGPPESVDLGELKPGVKAEFHWVDGPAPTTRATVRPARLVSTKS